jgi:hypothetical protein
MYLTKEEEKILAGEFGFASQISMKILVRLGELFDATELIPVDSVHLSGVSYKHLGSAAIDFLDSLAQGGGKTQVPTSLNPASFDPEYLVKKFSRERFNKQKQIINLYEHMGVKSLLTCTPYYISEPEIGQHLAWAESSAVIYANSVLNAWTNREGSPSALASALIGKTPNYGMHQAENRRPNISIKVETEIKNKAEYGALGIYLGKLVNEQIPLIDGLKNSSHDDLKQLGAAMAASCQSTIFHVKKTERNEGLETVSIEAKDISETIANLSAATKEPDMILIGCPHCSLREVKEVADLLENARLSQDIEFWVCTSKHVRDAGKNYVKTIERAGGRVLCDTCALVTWIKNLGVNTLMTNSAKTAFYAPTLNEVEVRFSPLKQCVQAALHNSGPKSK